ncbi:hypothetical protein TNCV_2399201 [Trichonephila clavipes]|uniref:Uncharacterized protein n=1 Tax=Trichonephila clavipes TaxID=2585209 RepID=A0A8X6VHD7_TRICX|nr:hypothetical protein TNCV_2399201 [Trichonephila clavipes]
MECQPYDFKNYPSMGQNFKRDRKFGISNWSFFLLIGGKDEGNILIMDSSFEYCSSLRSMCVALGSVTFPRLVDDRLAYPVRFHMCPPKIMTSHLQPTAMKQNKNLHST